MLHLIVSILIGIIAYAVASLFAEHRVAVVIGLLIGILWYFTGGLGM